MTARYKESALSFILSQANSNGGGSEEGPSGGGEDELIFAEAVLEGWGEWQKAVSQCLLLKEDRDIYFVHAHCITLCHARAYLLSVPSWNYCEIAE